ncbi:hypothetical protein D3C80_1484900 [compost metagenome]
MFPVALLYHLKLFPFGSKSATVALSALQKLWLLAVGALGSALIIKVSLIVKLLEPHRVTVFVISVIVRTLGPEFGSEEAGIVKLALPPVMVTVSDPFVVFAPTIE